MMLAWIAENLATILICLGLLLTVALILLHLIKGRKKGKPSCGCGCAHCTMAGTCRKE